jgi:photosystem II stability/assembly factor-like uncharacterized protein
MRRVYVCVAIFVAGLLIASVALAGTAPPAGWKKVGSATSTSIGAVSFANASTGLAYGYDKGILKSTNGGSSWSKIWTPPDGFTVSDLVMASSSVAYVVGSKYVEADDPDASGDVNVIYVTSDGGAHWTDKSNALGKGDLFRVVATDAHHAWAVGEYMQIFATIDGGTTWTKQNGTADNDGRFESLFFLNSQTGWAAGAEFSPGFKGVVFRTTNGGQTWTRTAVSTGSKLSAIGFSDAKHGWTAGYEADKFYKTTDGGATWKSVKFSLGGTPHMFGFTTTSKGWFVCGGLWQTVNGGKTWTKDLSKSSAWAFSMPTKSLAFAYIRGTNNKYQLYRWKK